MSLAERLLAAQQPVIVGTPCPDECPMHPSGTVEFHWPRGWQHLTADQCDVSAFRPGKDALALVAGHGVDVVDEDTKDGGSVDNLPPFTAYGVTRTPSGGRHFLVPGTGLGKVTGLATDAGPVGDYAAGRSDGTGRMLVYLPGTTRQKYPGGEYVEEVEWDVEKCLAADPEPDLVAAVQGAGGRSTVRERYIDTSEMADEPHPYAVRVVEAELARLDECTLLGWGGPGWDNTTYEAACNLHEVGNSGWTGLDLEDLHQRFLDHAPTDEGFGPSEHEAKWESARKTVDGGGRRMPDRPTPEDDFAVVSRDTTATGRFAFRSGGSFVLDTSPDAVPVWGSGNEVLMAEGEALIVASPQGLGKTTLAQQFALRRCGLHEDPLLGYPVEVGRGRVLYLAMDRPKQAARSLRRMVTEDMRGALDERLVVWEGPPPVDMAVDTDLLAEMCTAAGADTVVVDSLKDAALNLSEDGPAAAWNRARQSALQAGVQVVELHHNRKRQQGARQGAPGLDDVYGSTWITSGAGSVLLLTGQPGDLIVGLHHLKQPADPVGPLQVVHDHDAGATVVYHAADLVALAAASKGGITAREAAEALFETDDPTANEKKKAERRLNRLEKGGFLVVVQQGDAGSKTPTKWGRS